MSEIEYRRIAAQPIPDRADWREWCSKLHKIGVNFEFSMSHSNEWSTVRITDFRFDHARYRIPAQPIPAGIEKYLEIR